MGDRLDLVLVEGDLQFSGSLEKTGPDSLIEVPPSDDTLNIRTGVGLGLHL